MEGTVRQIVLAERVCNEIMKIIGQKKRSIVKVRNGIRNIYKRRNK